MMGTRDYWIYLYTRMNQRLRRRRVFIELIRILASHPRSRSSLRGLLRRHASTQEPKPQSHQQQRHQSIHSLRIHQYHLLTDTKKDPELTTLKPIAPTRMTRTRSTCTRGWNTSRRHSSCGNGCSQSTDPGCCY